MKWLGRWYGVFWIVASVFWIDVAWAKVHDLRMAGMPVSTLRWANLFFWIVMLIFWSRRVWMDRGAGKKGLSEAEG